MKLLNLRGLLLAGVAAVGLSAGAQAAVITRTFDVTVSDFEHYLGSAPTPPDPVTLNFTLTFDNAADVTATTTGLTINSFSLPYGAEFSYIALTDGLTLATAVVGLTSCGSPVDSFCAFMHDVSGPHPSVNSFGLSLPGNNYWRANEIRTTFVDAHPVTEVDDDPPAGVPEPATWAMLLIGFAGLGAAVRTARRAARNELDFARNEMT